MTSKLNSIRGMPDLLPDRTPLWQHLEDVARRVLEGYGYAEVRVPIVEKTELFTRSLGSTTDIVEKEMYTFEDRNGESLSLRPEGTAGVVRAAIQHGLLATPGQRLWYQGPMFRHERPQRGRLRQFHQIGVEVFGLEGADIDAELLLLGQRLWRALGIDNAVRLEINSLGAPADRRNYRGALYEWLDRRRSALDEDSLRRMETNPLRVLDSKNPAIVELLQQAPRMQDYLSDAARAHFERLGELLDAAGVQWHHNTNLVRGLDYYSDTVFEWVSGELGAQGTVCAGGRYDGLVELHGGPATPGVGFAMGEERLVELMAAADGWREQKVHVFLVIAGTELSGEAVRLAESLRDALPGLRLVVNAGGGSFKAQFRRADRSGADLALVLGEQEVANGVVTVKFLRDDRDQQSVPRDELATRLSAELGLSGQGVDNAKMSILESI